ncbi:Nuclear polyadenylated RNA-binding protein 4 [Madurella mycetomatis]|uniref:Nuclear polyadenylated RNA-binding protein 4 n=1 Tax=Madurella mycetomatis TaxID=100816 RepID=A0A175WAB9_9PEZI|nr:Nuclear polyadenylated RNA-binding protein 4 [Madurella mycetomatis]
MTEPENFDDELFADLYNDDEPASKPAAAQEPDQYSAVQAAAETKHDDAEDTGQYQDHNGGDTSQMRYEEEAEEDDDDDIDFNLGNGPSTVVTHQDEKPAYNAPPTPAPTAKGPNAKEDGKMFIGGLNWETTDQSLRDYFSQFGEVVECTVMRDGATGRSRGFGFLTFKDPKTVNIVMVKEHYLDGKIIDPKRAIPRDEQEKTSKIFVGGVSQETTDHEFREYFAQFGRVVDATLMMDKDTGRPRGFGFVTFESEAGVEACLAANLEIHGKPIEVKKAQPRGNLREEEDAARRGGKFGRKGQGPGNGMDDGSGGNQGGMAGMGSMGAGAAGMTPQVMAQYLQRMQQAFTMMQQQMMMNRNMNPAMNPAMMQHMMQMQQMQQMQQMMAAQQGRGGPGAGNAMGVNPAMMQQMMNQQGGSAPGGGMGGMSPGGGQQGAGGGGPNRPGYNAYEQQQFEQQKYEQQQQPQPPRRGNRGGGGGEMHQQAYNQGYMGGGGGQGGPTSWEGMYDDVPQPIMNQGGGGGFGGGGGRGGYHKNRGGHHQQQMQSPQSPMDPANAPPANAPTGPKNAGKPGANYRGGGRSGNRGFHPYARS